METTEKRKGGQWDTGQGQQRKVIPWRGASSHLELKRWYNSPLFISSQYQVFTCDLSTQGPLGSSPSWCIFGFLTKLMHLWVPHHADVSLGYLPCWCISGLFAMLTYSSWWCIFGLPAMLTCLWFTCHADILSVAPLSCFCVSSRMVVCKYLNVFSTKSW